MSEKRASTDAIAILKADHDKVTKLFEDFERLHEDEADEEAEQVAIQICNELTVHATVEEEIFYPEVREAIDDEDLLDEAEVEHATAKDLIAQILEMATADDKYAAKVIVLGEYIAHHVKEEQEEMFPKARKTDLDMKELGARILERKKALRAEMQLEDEVVEGTG
ncbi:MAG TPA: hemerythrin domain-containing protein [Burkholderiales bacterium]|nr:hemerythrin domain-containing protein [Burkholderiales bacterium]